MAAGGGGGLFFVCCVVVFVFKDQSLNNVENSTMKLSVNEVKLTVLWARKCATIQQVLILKFAFGPEKLPGLSRNEPQGLFNFVSGFRRAYK